jgi:hypothetical protein
MILILMLIFAGGCWIEKTGGREKKRGGGREGVERFLLWMGMGMGMEMNPPVSLVYLVYLAQRGLAASKREREKGKGKERNRGRGKHLIR